MRTRASGRGERILAAIEITALGLWAGGLAAFAFVFAPVAFRLIAPLDLGRFALLIGATLAILAKCGYLLGIVAIFGALARSASAGDRTADFIRAALIAIALGLTFVHQHTIVQAMLAVPDLTSPAYHALHAQSGAVYGAALLLVLVALVLAAARRD